MTQAPHPADAHFRPRLSIEVQPDTAPGYKQVNFRRFLMSLKSDLCANAQARDA